MYMYIQDDAGEKVNILGGDNVGDCERKKVYMNMCLIVNGYRDRAV
jgi:hypothetical protein